MGEDSKRTTNHPDVNTDENEGTVFFSNPLEWISHNVLHTDRTAEENAEFRHYYGRATLSMMKGGFWAFFVLILLTWPTDFLLYRFSRIVETLLILRATLLVLIPLLLFGIKWSDFLQNHAHALYTIATCGMLIFGGYMLGRLRTVEFLFAYALVVPMASLFLPVGIFKRTFVTFLFGFSYTIPYIYGSFVGLTPYHFLPHLVVVASVCLLVTIAGHLFYHIFRTQYFKSRDKNNDHRPE